MKTLFIINSGGKAHKTSIPPDVFGSLNRALKKQEELIEGIMKITQSFQDKWGK